MLSNRRIVSDDEKKVTVNSKLLQNEAKIVERQPTYGGRL
jgi:hypothetical protein